MRVGEEYRQLHGSGNVLLPQLGGGFMVLIVLLRLIIFMLHIFFLNIKFYLIIYFQLNHFD